MLLSPYNPMPHGKSVVKNFANVWMVDYIIIIFSMVCYNKYEYLQHEYEYLYSLWNDKRR